MSSIQKEMEVYRAHFEPMEQYDTLKVFQSNMKRYVRDIVTMRIPLETRHDIAIEMLEYISDNIYWFNTNIVFRRNIKEYLENMYHNENFIAVIPYYWDFYKEIIKK